MFQFRNLVPTYFTPRSDSDVWGKSLDLEQGKGYRLIAPSGAGKTSLVHFILGLRSNYQGAISFENREIGKFSSQRRATFLSQETGVVFQDIRLIPELTALENLELKAGLNPSFRDKIEPWATRLGVEEKLDQRVRSLSQGERQRVALCRSLLQPLKWLILDEPFAHLDDERLKHAWALIRENLDQQGAGLIFMSLDGSEPLGFDRELKL